MAALLFQVLDRQGITGLEVVSRQSSTSMVALPLSASHESLPNMQLSSGQDPRRLQTRNTETAIVSNKGAQRQYSASIESALLEVL